MTIRECYEKMGSDFSGVLSRLGSEALISKFAVKFLNDRSYEELRSACAEGRGEDAFRAAHTLKGVCSNLGFDRLYEASSALTEKLREEPHALTGTGELQAEVSRRYNETLAVLREFQG